MTIYSIYNSINGEVSPNVQGSFTTIIRVSGCNLNCSWCDTTYALNVKSGKKIQPSKIMNEVIKLGCKNVLITGGEPLLKKSLSELVDILISENYKVTIETNGSIQIPPWDNVRWIADWKLPSSTMSHHMKFENFINLCNEDFIKFVIADKTDFRVYQSVRRELEKVCMSKFVLSPAKDYVDPKLLIDWVKQSGDLDVIINLQLHKIIWPNEKNEV